LTNRLDIYASRVLRKCEALKKAGFWDREPRIQFRSWLNNFPEEDQPLAIQLLDKLIYYSDPMVDQMLITAAKHLPADLKSHRTFIVPVSGEEPNPTDSGYLFCRKARQLLNVDESQCATTQSLASQLQPSDTIIFLDDFVGTGNQISKTLIDLQRQIDPQISKTLHLHYLGLIATEKGSERIKKMGVSCTFCHTIGIEYHIKEMLKIEETTNHGAAAAIDATDFIERYAQTLRVPSHIDRLWGFGSIGLSVAFAHSVPDATIPLFWAKSQLPSWTPLVERS